MAVGRVGGTKSRITGQVGTTVFQVRKNEDGTYTQITLQKGVRTEEQTSERLQAQRMCTAMVESLMRDLKKVGQNSFQSAKNKTASLNAFSSYNLRLVARDCMNNWYNNNQFVYPFHERTDINVHDMGGLYILSAGTLQFNVFDAMDAVLNPRYVFRNWTQGGTRLYGLKFMVTASMQTVGDFLKAHRMTRLDIVCFCAFREWYQWGEDEDDPEYFLKHSYMMAQINPSVKDTDLLTPQTLANLFRFDTNHEVTTGVYSDGSGVMIGFKTLYEDNDEQIYYWGAFTISYITGKKMVSNASYSSPIGEVNPWLSGAAPTNVFGSWMGQGSVRHWPSPFQ